MKSMGRISILFYLAIALACSANAYGQSTDAPDILASQINQFLTTAPVDRPNQCYKGVCRPMLNFGNSLVEQGGQYSVNPRFIVAISGAESDFGAHMCAANNAWNWFWNGACPPLEKSPFDSWSSGIHTVSHFMHKSYILKGYNTIPLIGHRYCVDKCDFWEKNVSNFYQQLGGDMATLTWVPEAGGAPAPSPAPSPSPAPVETPAPITTSGQPQLTVHVDSVTSVPASGKSGNDTKLTLTAIISGATLISNPIVSRVVDGASEKIGPLSHTGADSNGQKTYQGEISVSNPRSQEIQLQVVGRYKVKSQTKQLTSTVSVLVPPPVNTLWWKFLLGVIVVLILVFVTLRLRRPPAKPQLVTEDRRRNAGAA